MLPASQLREKISCRGVDSISDATSREAVAASTIVHRMRGFGEPPTELSGPASGETTGLNPKLPGHDPIEFSRVVQW
jgi:hypothetical protein